MAHCCSQHEPNAFVAETVAASEPRVRETRFGSRITRALHASLVEPIATRLANRRHLKLHRRELLGLDERMRADVGVTAADIVRLTGREPVDSRRPARGVEGTHWFNDVHFNR